VTPILNKKLMITVKDMSMTIPVDHIWNEVHRMLPNENERNEFLQKLCEYQIEHINEIFDAQLQLAAKALEKKILTATPTYKDCLNKQTPGKRIGDKLYEGKENSPDVLVWEEKYKKIIVPKQATEHIMQQPRAQASIAFNLLINIQRMIFSVKWQLGTFGGIEVRNQDDTQTNVVPKNMVKILAVIDHVYKQDRTGTTMIWVDALNEVALIGRNAAENKPFKLFGERDAATQKFYDHFVKAFEHHDKTQVGKPGKKK
jgi:hypothetical protein